METDWVREIVAFAVAVVCVLALVPLIRRLCVRWRIFDPPGELKIHGEPIPMQTRLATNRRARKEPAGRRRYESQNQKRPLAR
jgi:hypothetical protein